MSRRWLMLAAVFCAAVGLSAGPAPAASEYCPARMGPLTPIDGEKAATLYSYTLTAESTRSVQGSAMIDTDAGWYQVPFPKTALTAWKFRFKTSSVEFMRTSFESPLLYVRFPQAVTIASAFVYDARSFGDADFGWDKRGDVQCQAPAGLEAAAARPVKASKPLLTVLNPRPRKVAPGAATPIVAAAPVRVPGSLDCAKPFVRATVTKPVPPQWPLGLRLSAPITTLVEVAVGATGHLDDAWIDTPSGSYWADREALAAARASTYEGGTSFCKPAPGTYIFRAEFNPQ
jgi:hypothetical protein